MKGLLALPLAALLAGCVTNMKGREVRIVEHPYAFRAHQLGYLVGVPEFDAPRRPLVVFVEGDGSACQAWSEPLWRRFLARFTGDYLLVRPRTWVSTICETPDFERADFDHRAAELEVVVSDVRARYPGRRLYLLGSSAGAHISLSVAERRPADVAGIVDLGGGLVQLSDVLPEIQREKARQGEISTAERDAAIAQLERISAEVRARAGSDAPFWGRTYRFWNQMFFSGVRERWLRFAGPVLVAHGTLDLESVPWSSVREAGPAFADRDVQFVFYDGLGHDLLDEKVMLDVDRWIGVQEARTDKMQP